MIESGSTVRAVTVGSEERLDADVGAEKVNVLEVAGKEDVLVGIEKVPAAVLFGIGAGAVNSAATVEVCSIMDEHSFAAMAPTTTSAHSGPIVSEKATMRSPAQS